MPLNPFDWTAEPFLTLYALLVAADLMVVVMLRSAIASGHAATAGDDLGPVELAYLRGGPATAADTILLSLLVAGDAKIEPKKPVVNINASGDPLSPDAEPYRAGISGPVTRERFHAAAAFGLGDLRARLVARGLVTDPARVASFRRSAALLLAALLAFGAAKVVVGVSRGKPVGFLLALMVGAAVIHCLLAFRGHYRSRAGTELLMRIRWSRARAARAPLPGELVMAFALTGSMVLTGTPYAPFKEFVQPSSGGDGGGGDGGDGGGGGCGGCS